MSFTSRAVGASARRRLARCLPCPLPAGSEHPADRAGQAEAVLRAGEARRAREKAGEAPARPRSRPRVGASALPPVPAVGTPYLADLDDALSAFGETAGDARRTFRFYLVPPPREGGRYYSKSSLKVTRLRQTVQTMCSAHTI